MGELNINVGNKNLNPLKIPSFFKDKAVTYTKKGEATVKGGDKKNFNIEQTSILKKKPDSKVIGMNYLEKSMDDFQRKKKFYDLSTDFFAKEKIQLNALIPFQKVVIDTITRDISKYRDENGIDENDLFFMYK